MAHATAPAGGKHVLAVDFVAGTHAQGTQNAAIEVEQDVGVAGVDRAVRVELLEVRPRHAHLVGRGLQQAVAAFLATRAEMIALDKQHLQERFALGVDFFGVALDLQRGTDRLRAGRNQTAIDLDVAQATGAMRGKVRMPAQVRDVAPGTRGSLQHGLAGGKRQLAAVEHKVQGRLRRVHVRSSRCAPASSRPVMRRATDSSASRSKPGSNCSHFMRRS